MKINLLVQQAIALDPSALRACATRLRGDLLAGTVVHKIVSPIAKAWGVEAWRPSWGDWRSIADIWAQRLDAKAAELEAESEELSGN
jgi:hypothetical protein